MYPKEKRDLPQSAVVLLKVLALMFLGVRKTGVVGDDIISLPLVLL